MIRHRVFPAGSVILLTILFAGMSSCRQGGTEKKRIVYVNSYHSGFPPSDEITKGIYEKLPADSFEIFPHFMDTKRNPSEAYIRGRAAELLDTIKLENPDLLIVSDDNAVKYLVEPHARDIGVPIVFCGVNWSVGQYDLSGNNITGILEILPVAELLELMKPYYPSMQKLLVLNENTTTSRKTKPILDTLCERFGISVTQVLVDDFAGWKAAFEEANQSHDMIYLQTRGAIKNWDHDEALRFIGQHIKVPVVTCEDFMMPYAVLGLTQLSKEQGLRAAETAKIILQGTRPGDIPISRNHMTKLWMNPGLAGKINFLPDAGLMSKAEIVK